MKTGKLMPLEEYRHEHLIEYMKSKMPNYKCSCCASEQHPWPTIWEDGQLGFELREIYKPLGNNELELERKDPMFRLMCPFCSSYFYLSPSSVGFYFLQKEGV